MTRWAGLAVALLAVPAAAYAAPPATPIACAGQDATAAINAVLLAGGHAALSAGTCLISAPLTPGEGAVLSGAGMAAERGPATVLRAASGGFNMVDIGHGRRITAATVSALTIDAGAPRGGERHSGPVGEGIMVWPDGSGVTIDRVEVKGAADDGVRFAGSDNVLENSYVHDNWHDGVFVQSQNGRPVLGNRIVANRVTYNSRELPPGWERTHPGEPAWDGINLGQRAGQTLIQNNLVVYNDIRSNSRIAPVYGNQAIGNTVQDSAQGCVAFGTGERAVVISGNIVRNCRPHSLAIGRGSQGSITGNTVVGGGATPIAAGPETTQTGNRLQ